MDFYVYLHKKKTTGEVFYVGKGCGNRAWDKNARSKYWKSVYNKHGCVVEIVQNNLQEWYAYELEHDTILMYKLSSDGGSLCNLTLGGGIFLSGLSNPNADTRLWTFLNTRNGECVTTTKVGFKTMFPQVSMSRLFRPHATSCGWVVTELTDAKTIDRRVNRTHKENNLRTDNKIYEWINIHTLEKLSCTRAELERVSPEIHVNAIRETGNLSSHGWTTISIF